MDNLIRLSSVTQSLRARDLLKAHGITAVVTRIPATKKGESCGYGLKIEKKLDEAAVILKNNNIKFSGRAFGGFI